MLLLTLAVPSAGLAGHLRPERLAVLFNEFDAASSRVAAYYAEHRQIPRQNLIGVPLVPAPTIDRTTLRRLRERVLSSIPTEVQSLLIVWSHPFAVECMSITSAFAAGFSEDFCKPGCAPTRRNPLFDQDDWLPADTVGWLPAMLLPTEDEALAHALIDRGIKADGSRPPGTVYLVHTQDGARNVRTARYADAQAYLAGRLRVEEIDAPRDHGPKDIVGYFTGAVWVKELPLLGFRAGAAADHLTSAGGVLEGGRQMSALDWLRQGATASYGTVSEPCNHPEKFPDPAVLFKHYLRGDTLLEAYWKSVAMPGQGLFLGEPLAHPFAP